MFIAWLARIFHVSGGKSKMHSDLVAGKADSTQSDAEPMSSDHESPATQDNPQTSQTISSETTTPPEPTLLGMPPEIRNIIYRYTLLSESMIKVTATSPSQPALLRTNRQLRTEALPIFLTENTFKVDAWDMQLSIPSNYAEHWLSRIAYKSFFITMRGKKDWGNLKGWLGRYARHEVPGLAAGQPTPEAEILAQAFELVYCLLPKCGFEGMGGVVEAWIKTVELAGVEFDFQ
ncbi:hypothetical protein PRZ48_010520 [Zasmidium cellare]|uniref:Uncharacterized protein n=1 Tax=Zasmidium cellare TaxID=395010 RepID=A0ABR0E915_ZASCE|nr:hypothetical protein PRZ48_010520 [Zasmidium cellare]